MSVGQSETPTLSDAIDALLEASTQASTRLNALADYCIAELEDRSVRDLKGGSRGESKIEGFGRAKNWDVSLVYKTKPRLLVSLKSILKNMTGTVPNRLDDLMGEVANVQHLFPELVIGYVCVLDEAENAVRRADKHRPDCSWIDYFERRVSALSIRSPPIWGLGLIEGSWIIRIDSRNNPGQRILAPDGTLERGAKFVDHLVKSLVAREPAVPLAPSPPDV